MSDSELPRQSEAVEALKRLAQMPQRRAGANTETTALNFPPSALSQRITGTDLVDVRALAEGLMFDATTLASRLDQMAETSTEVVPDQPRDSVRMASVLRGGAAVAGSFASFCLAGNLISGTVLLHPLLAWMTILSSIGFYAMGKVKP